MCSLWKSGIHNTFWIKFCFLRKPGKKFCMLHRVVQSSVHTFSRFTFILESKNRQLNIWSDFVGGRYGGHCASDGGVSIRGEWRHAARRTPANHRWYPPRSRQVHHRKGAQRHHCRHQVNISKNMRTVLNMNYMTHNYGFNNINCHSIAVAKSIFKTVGNILRPKN